MNNKIYSALMSIAIITQISAMDDEAKKSLVGKNVVRETVDANNRLVRNGVVVKDPCDSGNEFCFYIFNNKYAFNTFAFGTGVTTIVSAVTMDPTAIVAAAAFGTCLLTSGAIKATQMIEENCKKCKPADDDAV